MVFTQDPQQTMVPIMSSKVDAYVSGWYTCDHLPVDWFSSLPM